jgi:glycosyltransferase involved in cell wall biosynthesis
MDLLFLMVGDGPNRSAVEALVEEYDLRDVFCFLGMKAEDQIPFVLSACDAAVLPDCLDSICPIKVLEYMAMSLPAIVPDYEANREIVKDGVNGLCFRPQHPGDLADRIMHLAKNPITAREIGVAARTTVCEVASWEKTWGSALKDIISQIGK